MSPKRRRSNSSRFDKSWFILLWLGALLVCLAVVGLLVKNQMWSTRANKMPRVMTSLELVPTSTHDFLLAMAQQWSTPETKSCCALHLLSGKLNEGAGSNNEDSVDVPSHATLPWQMILQLANVSLEIQFQFVLHLRFTCLESGESAWSVIEERIDLEHGLEPFASIDHCKWLDPKQLVDSQGQPFALKRGMLTEASLDGRNWVRVRSQGDERSNDPNQRPGIHIGKKRAIP